MYTVWVPFSLHSAMPSMRPGSLYACETRGAEAANKQAQRLLFSVLQTSTHPFRMGRTTLSCPAPIVRTCFYRGSWQLLGFAGANT